MKCDDNNKLVLKKNNYPTNLIILQSVLLVLSFVVGSVLILLGFKYLKHITILKTFFILIYVYFFQLLVEIMKCFITCVKYKNSNEIVFKWNKVFNFKFLIINFLTFLVVGVIALGCLLCSLFFSSFKILFILLMGILLGLVYLFYSIELFKLIDLNFKKYDIERFKENVRDFLILCLINTLFIILITNIFYLIKYLYAFVFVFVVLLNLILFNVNEKYLKKKF